MRRLTPGPGRCAAEEDDAIATIETMRAKPGEPGVLLIQATHWAEWENIKRSDPLYARSVMPHFSGVNRDRVQSSRGWK